MRNCMVSGVAISSTECEKRLLAPVCTFLVLIQLLLLCSGSRGEDSLEGRQCRSVHLRYFGTESVTFYNEVTVNQSASGTYFMVCGWTGGYFGIQDRPDGSKRVIFSVWDSSQDDKNAVEEDKRVQLLYKDEQVRIGRFGGEGTGGQSFFDYDWKPGVRYRFKVSAEVQGERTAFAGYFYVPEEHAWKHLVTFSTITGNGPLDGEVWYVEPVVKGAG